MVTFIRREEELELEPQPMTTRPRLGGTVVLSNCMRLPAREKKERRLRVNGTSDWFEDAHH